MKRKAVSLLIVSFLLALMSIPAFATSISWSLTMDERYVNGLNNGVTHSMTAGSMTLSGYLDPTTPDDDGALSTPYTVYIGVLKEVTGTDTELGYASITPNLDGTSKSFSKSYGSQAAGTYYIVCFKNFDDGWNEAAWGTLVTQ